MRHLLAVFVASLVPLAAAPAQAAWATLYPPVSPTARDAAVMAAHEATGDIVLFSGAQSMTGGWGYAADCWILQGAVWSPYAGAMPQPRIFSAMSYDESRQRLVLFGGAAQGGVLNDTWEWDGSAWSQRSSPVVPPARRQHAMAYDRLRGVTVLFGGESSSSGSFLGDVWEWDGTAWVDRTPPGGPGALASPVMAFDPVRLDCLMYGGRRSVGGTQLPSNETWSWDGSSWLQQTPMQPPWFRGEERAVTDLHRQRVVLHGGNSGDPFTWEWDGSEWNVRLQGSPGPRESHAMAYDPQARRVVLFGGFTAYGRVADTWVLATSTPAAVVPYGSGCPGAVGEPELGNAPFSLPWIGDVYRSQLSNLAPASLGAFFATGYASTQPVSLSVAGMPGCELVVAVGAAEFRAAVNQRAEWQLAIPNTATLAGVQLFQQGFALEIGANPAGLTVSNGIEITTGIR